MSSSRVLLRVEVDALPNFGIDADSAVERDAWTWLLKPWGPETPYTVPVRVTFGFRFADKRERDIDGFSAATKPLMDAMVDLAWLYDDNTKWVKFVGHEVLEDGEPRTVVTIEGVNNA